MTALDVIETFWRRERGSDRDRRPGRVAERTALIEARGVTVRYGSVAVLCGIDIDVRAGEVLALVGPNGAGKSTLLGVLAGDLTPDAGVVLIDGRPLREWTTTELAVRRGVLLQQVDVSFPFTVTEVVRMGRAPWAGSGAEAWDDDVVAEAMAETDTGHLAARTYTTLSGGERSRAALARVVAQEPVALLLDEPTASLDVRHQALVLQLARRRAARGDAVAVVLHDLGLAAACADTVAVLSGGRVVAAGPPVDVLTADLLSDVYGHPIDVFANPMTGAMVVEPRRASEAS